MSGSKLGYISGEQTKKYLAYLEDEQFIKDMTKIAKQKEIKDNQTIWIMALDYLKELDQNFDEWYDGADSPIPETIVWTGNDFQENLNIVLNRIIKIKKQTKGVIDK